MRNGLSKRWGRKATLRKNTFCVFCYYVYRDDWGDVEEWGCPAFPLLDIFIIAIIDLYSRQSSSLCLCILSSSVMS